VKASKQGLLADHLSTNQTWLQILGSYSFPVMNDTKCQKLHLAVRQLLKEEVKGASAPLARLQMFVLDVVAPLVKIAEDAWKGSLTVDLTAEAVVSPSPAEECLSPGGNREVEKGNKTPLHEMTWHIPKERKKKTFDRKRQGTRSRETLTRSTIKTTCVMNSVYT